MCLSTTERAATPKRLHCACSGRQHESARATGWLAHDRPRRCAEPTFPIAYARAMLACLSLLLFSAGCKHGDAPAPPPAPALASSSDADAEFWRWFAGHQDEVAHIMT